MGGEEPLEFGDEDAPDDDGDSTDLAAFGDADEDDVSSFFGDLGNSPVRIGFFSDRDRLFCVAIEAGECT